MADFIPGFPVKCNFDGLSPVTLHSQPSPLLIFCAGGVVAQSLHCGSSISQSLSLSNSEHLSFSDETSSSPLALSSNNRSISFWEGKRNLLAMITTTDQLRTTDKDILKVDS